jgi:nitrous oxidase accessory protein NosD
MQNTLFRKGIAFIVIFLFIGLSITSTGRVLERSSTLSSDGNTFYVGGSGLGNYTKIQDAIDNASDGDTVFVYNGKYIENLMVDKSITLIGEDKKSTIVEGRGSNRVVTIRKSYVVISGFTIQNGEHGIELDGSNSTISGNIITNIKTQFTVTALDAFGILIRGSDNNITGNIITHTTCYFPYCVAIGMYISGKNHDIKGNIIDKTRGFIVFGMLVSKYGHIFDNNPNGNNIIRNTIRNTKGFLSYGLSISLCENTTISKNNFLNNKRNAHFYNPLQYIKTNIWSKNYWNRPRIIPYIILGQRHLKTIDPDPIMIDDEIYISIPWLQFDRNPAQEPYDI